MSEIVTVVGSIVKEDPTLEYSPTGLAIGKFSIRVPGRKNEDGTKGEATFYDIVCWRELGENVVQTLRKDDRVIVRGKLNHRTWEYEGKTYERTEVNAWNVGPDLSFVTAGIDRTERLATVGTGSGDFGSF